MDVSYDDKTIINTASEGKDIDIDDEAVKDRWSRYIGAMGVEAVAKQSKAQIFLSGASAVGIEIAKNMVLAGCKTFTFHDTKVCTEIDLAGQFFLNKDDIGKQRLDSCLHRLQQLNSYVRCRAGPSKEIPLTEEELKAEPWCLDK